MYYVVVLVTEISMLTSETARRKLAAAGSSWKKSGLLSSQVSRESASFDPGQVSNAMNPTFLKVNGPGEEETAGIKDMAAAIQSTTEPPSRQLWATFQSTMQGMLTTIAATEEQLRALVAEKEALEFAAQAAAGSLAVGKAGAGARSAIQRKEFSATTRGRGPSAAAAAAADDGDSPASSPNPLRAARAGALSGRSGGGGGGGGGGGSPAADSPASSRGLSAARAPAGSGGSGAPGPVSSLDSPNPLRAATAAAGKASGAKQAALLQGYASKRK